LNRHPMAYNMNTRVRWDAVRRILAPINLTGVRTLDVGCGLGFFSAGFKAMGAEVDAVDVDAGAVEYVTQHLGIPAQILDVEHSSLPTGAYDLVFVGEVLEHVKDPSHLYAKLHDALRPGGMLLVTTPALEGWLAMSPGKQLGHDHGGQKHEREGYWAAELRDLARSAELEVLRQEACLFTVAELFMQLTKLGYLLVRPGYEGQSDVLSATRGAGYRLLRVVFSIVWPLVKVETAIAPRLHLHGHCHLQLSRRIPAPVAERGTASI
jgi:2-polyprenyl-3-methyl-5-hydroxy-6-metoxy-1,4-benzoquinol methylase